MNNNWITYLFVIGLAFLCSCGVADESLEGMTKESVMAEDAYEEGENAVYAEAATEEMVKEADYEHSKGVVKEELNAVIPTEQLVALQGRAEQKVKELFEYVTIMSNDGYDIEMRKNAKKMAINLFDEKAKLYAPSITGGEDSVAVKSILKDVLKGKIKLNEINIEAIGVEDGETVYCKLIANNVDFSLVFKVNMEFEIKQFGNERLEVWSVYLGDVKEY